MEIRFGTSGWRAVIADDFTFDNVRQVVTAICRYLKTQNKQGVVVIGHDSRFMGEKFSDIASTIVRSFGYEVKICTGPTPTPVLAFAIKKNKALGGINFTASHNPPEYQGIKFSTSDGAPALPEITKEIERLVAEGTNEDTSGEGMATIYDPYTDYAADLRSKVRFDVIAASKPKYVYDPLWGTGRGYLDRLLKEEGIEVETINDWRDVTFGGMSPEPGEKQLQSVRENVLKNGCTLGISTDGDGDRFGVVDADGTIIQPNQLIAILADYLLEERGWKLGLARSVATSHLIDKVAKLHDVELYETPVGFKYIGELIINDKIVLGGEESAGLSIRGHYPEKDGLIACLLAAEAVAARKKSLREQLKELFEKVGELHSIRTGVKLTPEIQGKLNEKLAIDPQEIDGRKVLRVDRTDGVKFFFENDSWMLMRPSGTEPMVRIYAESVSSGECQNLIKAGENYLLGN